MRCRVPGQIVQRLFQTNLFHAGSGRCYPRLGCVRSLPRQHRPILHYIKGVISVLLPGQVSETPSPIGGNWQGSCAVAGHAIFGLQTVRHAQQRPYSLQVQFTLHNSFAVPTRDCSSAPYLVHEQGWGEFDVGIKVRLHSSID